MKFSFKPNAFASTAEEKKIEPPKPFGSSFNAEAKLFANKNLFANPMISKDYPRLSEPRLKLSNDQNGQNLSKEKMPTLKLGGSKSKTAVE